MLRRTYSFRRAAFSFSLGHWLTQGTGPNHPSNKVRDERTMQEEGTTIRFEREVAAECVRVNESRECERQFRLIAPRSDPYPTTERFALRPLWMLGEVIGDVEPRIPAAEAPTRCAAHIVRSLVRGSRCFAEWNQK
jgi:hypothetical protein